MTTDTSASTPEAPTTDAPTSSRRRFGISAAIIVFGLLGAVALVVTRPQPARTVEERTAPAVTAIALEARTEALMVEATGTVRPTAEISLSAQVPGRVVGMSPDLARGGAFRRGDTLLVIEPASYQNAVRIAQADVAQRQVDIALAQQEQVIAQEEYRLLQARTGRAAVSDTSLASRLALQQPQLEAARASLARAEAQLSDARLNLGRTVLTAPFTGQVRSESVDLGQFVGAGQSIADLYATAEVEVVVSLSTRQAALIDGLWSDRTVRRTAVVVRSEFGGFWHEWDGYVDRTAGALDETTRTIEVVVRVPDAFASDGRPPLLVGSFVRADIEGRSLDRLFAVPRPALRDGNFLWVVQADGRLRAEAVEVVQEVQDTVFVRSGLEPGVQVVISDLAVMTDGMEVSLQSAPRPASSGSDR